MKITGLDIPDEYVTLYNKVVKFLDPLGNGIVSFQYNTASRYRADQLYLYSLFVKWSPIWQGLTHDQRVGWAEYWVTLPFGPHTGLGGYPGSSFSAFVYYNAIRRRTNAPMRLDAPNSINMLTNPTFFPALSPWSILLGATYFLGVLTFHNDNYPDYFSAVLQNYDLVTDVYTQKIRVTGHFDGVGEVAIAFDGFSPIPSWNINGDEVHSYDYDNVYWVGTQPCVVFGVHGGGGAFVGQVKSIKIAAL